MHSSALTIHVAVKYSQVLSFGSATSIDVEEQLYKFARTLGIIVVTISQVSL